MSYSQADLGNALAQCADYVAAIDWGCPDLLFGIVPTALLASSAPELVDEGDDSVLSPVLQDPEDPYADTETVLATTAWPEQVVGCALVTEITVVPPGDSAPDGSTPRDGALQPGAGGRRARLIGGVLRTGQRLALLALEPDPERPDDPNHLRTHPELAPDLLDALAATFAD